MEKHEILNAVQEWAERQKRFNGGTFSDIPVSGALIGPDDVVNLVDTVLGGWYTEHRACAGFARELMSVCRQNYVQLVNSGSSANLVAILSCIEAVRSTGKFVLTCATGFPTTVAPIYQAGKIPVYVDIDPYTLEPDYMGIREAVRMYGDALCGAIFAHTLGFSYDEKLVADILKRGNPSRWLIADCCDALGVHYTSELGDGNELYPVGMYADAMTLSFFPAHGITSAEGGAVLTNIYSLHQVAQSLVNWGRDCWCLPGQSNVCGCRFSQEDFPSLPEGFDHKYTFTRLGYNLKMTEFQGALGLSQIQKLDNFNGIRQKNFHYFDDAIQGNEWITTVITCESDYNVPFGIPIIVRPDAPFEPKDLIAYLEERGVKTRRVFGGNITRQPGYKDREYMTVNQPLGSDFVMTNVFWVGCWPGLTTAHMDKILEYIEEFTETYA